MKSARVLGWCKASALKQDGEGAGFARLFCEVPLSFRQICPIISEDFNAVRLLPQIVYAESKSNFLQERNHGRQGWKEI